MSGRLVNPWTPGTSYPPGSVVRPTSTTGTSASPPTNGGFETGDFTGWTAGAGYSVVTTSPYLGTKCAQLAAGSGSNIDLVNTNQGATVFGQKITGYCYINCGAASSGALGSCTLTFYDASHVALATYVGTAVVARGSTGWALATVTATSLIGSAFVAIGARCTNTSGSPMFVDNFYWDYISTPYDAPLLFYAVQTGTGKSGFTEPTWATTPPNITDGTVIWSSNAPTSITWYTQPLMKSGSLEPGTFGGPPAWPTSPGLTIHDSLGIAMDWETVTPQITDANCPHSKYVMTAASKIFAADNDIVRFSATTDPTDWTTEADAGFLPTGLQAYGKNPFKAVGLYRSNGVFFNADGMQMWQLDEDPANMALLDAIPVGCTQNRTLAPVNNDLFFTAAQGDRTMGISAGSGNLQAGDVGMPVDLFVQAAVAAGITPIGTYYPSTGQRWLAFPGWNDSAYFVTPGSSTTTTVLVYTMTRIGEVGAWSRYLLPYVVQDFTQLADGLYVRATEPSGADIIALIDPTQLTDTYSTGSPTTFTATIQWPWLDDGQPGLTKKLDGMDFVVTLETAGSYTMQVGYDQTDKTSTGFTTAYTLTNDTLPGLPIPMELSAPTFSIRLTLTSDTNWTVYEVNLLLQDQAPPT